MTGTEMENPALRRRVVLYGKPDCSLCDYAAGVLARVAERVPFPLDIVRVDITTDPVLEARYGPVIPVVELDDGTVIEAEISEWRLLRLLGVASPAGER
jgi:thiol-disulfide isomerase/thioredoxin